MTIWNYVKDPMCPNESLPLGKTVLAAMLHRDGFQRYIKTINISDELPFGVIYAWAELPPVPPLVAPISIDDTDEMDAVR